MNATMIDRLSARLKTGLKGYDAGADLILIDERHSEASLRELARTVLVEMRAPTDNMRRAGGAFFELDNPAAAEAAAIVFAEMIEAALTE